MAWVLLRNRAHGAGVIVCLLDLRAQKRYTRQTLSETMPDLLLSNGLGYGVRSCRAVVTMAEGLLPYADEPWRFDPHGWTTIHF